MHCHDAVLCLMAGLIWGTFFNSAVLVGLLSVHKEFLPAGARVSQHVYQETLEVLCLRVDLGRPAFKDNTECHVTVHFQ